MEEKNKTEKKKRKKKYRGLRIFGKILLGLFIFILLILLFVRSPWGQNIIKNQVISSISNTTNTTIEVDRLFITFSGNIFVDGLYMEDRKGDTLIYSEELEANVPLWPIFQGEGIAVNSLEWKGVRANVIREDSTTGFNYEFLMEAFAPADTTTTAATEQDTATAGQQFGLGDIELSNFDVVYNDRVLGIESRYRVGELNLEMEKTDLENMRFEASEASIFNSIIDYRQTPVPENPNAEEPPMPVFRIDQLELHKVAANYESVPAGMLAQVELEDFLIELPLANLAKNIIEIDDLQMNNSSILLRTTATPEKEVTQNTAEESLEGFQWPEWKVEVADISFSNNKLTYITNDAQPEAGVFNPEALDFQNLELTAKNLYLRNEEAGANINNLSFNETGGINLKNFRLNAGIDNQTLQIEELLVDLNENHLEGNLDIRYDSMEDLINRPENSVIEANLPDFHLNLQDLFLIQPDLQSNEYLTTLSQKPVYGGIRAEGTLASLQISQANLHWGATTSIAARGSIQNPTDPENLQFTFPRIKMVSQKGDIQQFIDEEQLNIKLPEEFNLIADVSGNTEDIEAVAQLTSSAGKIDLEGSFYSSEGISFNADLAVSDLALGSILQNEQLGNLNLTLTTSGQGENTNELDATLEANIDSFHYNEYPIEDLKIMGEISNGRGPVNMQYEDENLNMEMESIVILDSISPQVNMSLNIIGANLEALGLAQKNIRVAFELDGSFRGNAENFDVNAEIGDGVAVYDNNSYLLGDFGLSARVRPDSTAMDVQNQMIDVRLRSNTDPTSFANALQRHFRSYFSDDIEIDTVNNPVNLELRAEIRENPILDEVFINSLDGMDTINIAVDFHERKRELTADVELPFINYMGNEIDSLSFHLDSGRENLDFVLGFNALDAGPLAIKRTDLEGEIIDDILHLDFNSYYEDEHLVHIRSELTRANDSIVLQLDPSEVILNSSLWEVPESNRIFFAENTVFKDFTFVRNNQRMEITNEQPGIEGQHIGILFENFRLASFLSYLNPETPLATGRLNGNFTIQDPGGKPGLLAGLEITGFEIMEVPMGTLTMEADAVGTEAYNFDLAIKGENIDLDLTGGFDANETGAQWDTELILNEVQMEVVQGFSQGEIINTSGSFSGHISLGGTTADPVYEGTIDFNQAALTIAMMNAPFVLPDETLRLNNEGFYFDNFNVQDQNDNRFTLNGEVLTESLLNPSFDLDFEADNFMLLNSDADDNDLYYGTAVVDATGSLTGNLNVPKVDLNLVVGSETDFTYVIPPSEVAIEERDGIVSFVNRENPDDILTATEEETYTLSGFEISSTLTVREGAGFTVIINEQTGDNFKVSGSGDFNFNISTSGRTTLSGRYVVSGGHYEMNLYGLVNRRFELVEGSTVTWMGNPFDANLDIRARYRVETSASSLMAAQTSGAAASERTRFRQELDFLVYLNIEGEIMQPVLSFGLDMPEEEQGAIGGQVYGRIQQVNQQEQELNRQVFSLLVLNRFYPEGTNDGSGGGTMAIARDNLNNALSDQLNMLSNNLLGEDSDFALDFGLDSYTDYQGASPQERTQLDIAAETSFMDDRLVVRVGSEVDIQGSNQEPGATNPLIGNVSIEYLVTENGRWRFKGFRRNSFENVIEGQVIVSGIALIFSREFNEFKELWKSLNLVGEEDSNEE